ncbi:tetratricopeptide repeat protein [Streptomyces alanosinicus]|uniref:tetratricopeptide repeat protein n=1 Tax=Streptomyces alanosinicus TaxID=68171 RepID=UPI001E4DA155|nr:tetratricopeptide repeat protein [Streptomyces alanosinicus]
MEGNFRLQAHMTERAFKQGMLADRVNDELKAAGHNGTVGDRTVRNWVTGKTHWPHQRQRDALTAVFGCTPVCLGFYPPGTPAPPDEDPSAMLRRRFCTAATSAIAATALPAVGTRPTTVGTSDVLRLRDGLDKLTALDQKRGGHAALERAALAGAAEAVGLQDHSASQTIRQRLFGVAADYTTAAAWSCIDARQLDRARLHVNEALRLAGLSQDPVSLMRVWNSTSILAHQLGHYAEGVAAAQAAQSCAITRRDPLFGSLAHARAAVGHAYQGDRQSAIRSIGYAEEALVRAEARPRPSWVAFYGPAELHALTGVVRSRLGQPAEAEAASHRALSALPAPYRRNRAMTTVDLAIAQLRQGDAEQACATTEDVFTLMSGSPLPGRLRVLLGDFYRDLLTLAPSTIVAREWADRYRSEWSPA